METEKTKKKIRNSRKFLNIYVLIKDGWKIGTATPYAYLEEEKRIFIIENAEKYINSKWK